MFHAMFALLLVLQSAADGGPTYSGLSKQLDVRIPRFEAAATIDGVAAGAAGGPSAGGRFDATIDLNPDYVYESRGRVTARGYEVEVRIPFKSLRYQSADPQDWGIQVVRSVQHSGYEETWTPAVRANASFLVQSGRLIGLGALRRGLVLDLTPEFTTKVDGAPTAPGYDYRGTPEVAGNLRWGVTQNLGLTATA